MASGVVRTDGSILVERRTIVEDLVKNPERVGCHPERRRKEFYAAA